MTESASLSEIKIAVVDDHHLIRVGIHTILAHHGAHNVQTFDSASSILKLIDAGESFDFFIVDLDLPDINGFALIEKIRARHPQARIIVSTLHDEIWTLRRLLPLNVNAIIYKSAHANQLIAAINEILKGNRYYCDAVNKSLSLAADSSLHPSSRELEVLSHIARGKSSREIAALLFVSDNTIEAHRKSLFSKLGAVNVADLIVKAFQKGYLGSHGILW